jgi:LCP family protein required for cell wall assembly
MPTHFALITGRDLRGLRGRAALPDAATWRSLARNAWRVSLVVVGLVLVAVATLAGVKAWSINQAFDSQITRIPDAVPAGPALPPVRGTESVPAQNLLLLGTDLPGALDQSLNQLGAQNLLSVLVVHFAADRRSVQVVAVPRDVLLGPARDADEAGDATDEGVPFEEANATLDSTLTAGGVPSVVDAVEDYFRVKLDRVGVFQLSALELLTDAVGGVTVQNPVPFTASGHSFSRGSQELDGAEVLTFVSERNALVDGELQRIQNQNILLRALLLSLSDSDKLTNLRLLGELLAAVTPQLAADDGLTVGYLGGLGLELADLREDVHFLAVPAVPVAAAVPAAAEATGVESAYEIPTQDLAALRQAFQTDDFARFEG